MPLVDHDPALHDELVPAEKSAPSLKAAQSRRAVNLRGVTKARPVQGTALPDPHLLTAIYEGLRNQTRALAVPLSAEDQSVQSMPEASPTKWHLAHTTWFFETFVLSAHQADYKPFDENYRVLFNSYYEAVGAKHPRAQRGLLTRPSCDDVGRYRAHVDSHMASFMASFATGPRAAWDKLAALIVLGCHHEQQHQELILMDILHAFSCNPLRPAYAPRVAQAPRADAALRWINFPGGDYDIGHRGPNFAFDNESPCHVVKLQPFAMGSRAVNNGEWLEFIEAGGYAKPELWLADGWDVVRKEGWNAPLYWSTDARGAWQRFTLGGEGPLDPAAPVCNISYYEADAYARWRGKRLPTEAEWEVAADSQSVSGDIAGANLLETGALEPLAPAWGDGYGPQAMFGDVWEWTQSPYTAYPGFKPGDGAIGEYNGKFMINQMVLRGGSCLTPASHIRATYRNFFYPHMRWQFAGLRLADTL